MIDYWPTTYKKWQQSWLEWKKAIIFHEIDGVDINSL